MDDPNVGVLLLPVSAPTPAMRQPLIDMATHAVKRGDKPIVALALMPGTDDPVYQAVVEAGVPVVRNMRNAMSAVRALMRHPARVFPDGVAPRVSPDALAAPSTRSRALDEPEALAWLAEQGISSARHEFVPVGEDVVAAAERIGYPVVLKAVSPELLHKSERGGVKVGLGDADEVGRAHREMAATLDDLPIRGYIIASMIKGGVELLAGISRDPLLGPTVVIGSGGVAAEAMRDTSLSVLPFDRARAAQMVERLRVAPLLGEWRGQPALDKEAVIDTVMTLQEIAARGRVVELDINPLLVREHGAVMLDAVVILEGDEA
ncbi:hypothetical protein FXW78_18200 [Rhodococcus opacus]|nr:hypothetical protein [Rhodococcus opacus]